MRRNQPLYQQVRERLLERITSGELSVGDRLEPEIELAEEYNVSRATMRNAIRGLVQEGLLTRRPGVGTMVIRSAPEVNASNLELLLEYLGRNNPESQLLVLDAQITEASPQIREKLHLENGCEVLHVFRICKIAGSTVAVAHTYIPADIGISAAEVRLVPLYDLLEHTYQKPISFGHDTISSTAAEGETAKLLSVKAGSPLLAVNRESRGGSSEPLEYSEALFRSDAFQYSVTLRREIDIF